MDQMWQEKWSKYGVKAYFIMIADQQGGPPSEAACQKFRDDYDIQGGTLLYDPTGISAQYGGQETTYILNPDAQLTYVQQGDWMAGIEKELEKVLGVEME